ncbi:adenylate/guanylate cyclase domain-containing protein [Argonema galeatum]|uniref:adenylate/guanylate cyclase domain-containing protein n=1 Tax=Argonema galeatum TaxID=2942762 RepID=UPI0020112059|nr:adenylate/guanylate cyclase domain-containing protein [Argonema galeatum]MCL1468770.1 adenylate/guanylate cyclase domain-containing protein [Argonema galeatum A003/A1]
MLIFNRFSIKSKIQIMLLMASLGSILVVGYLSWSKIRGAIEDKIYNQLTSVRTSKAYQIESYFKNMRHHVETLCEDRMVVAAMVEFNRAYRELDQQYIAPEWNAASEDYYKKEFFSRLSKVIPGEPDIETYRPYTQPARYLQYQYIAKNTNPVGKKDELVDAQDGSEYSKFHSKYHPIFRNLIKKFGYYDFFLINFKTGEVAYTVYKETDFGTNLEKGPYKESNLAEVVAAVQKSPDRGAIQIVDFKPYRPSYMAPAAFIAGPIYNGPHIVGILAIQLPVDEINNVLTGNKNWKQDGLGNTGETYMIGSDMLMRSVSRFLIEDPKGYQAALKSIGTPESNMQLIERLGTSILLQNVNTPSAQAAIAGIQGTTIVKDYRGRTVLSSYGPLKLEGLDWGIIAEMDLSEAYQPVYALQRDLFIATVILVLLIVYLANVAAHSFVRPLEVMIAGARKVGEEDPSFEEVLNSRNEFGDLAQLVKEMAHGVHNQTNLLAQKNRENEALLLSILPSKVVERLKKGEERIADRIEQVTVISATIFGLTKLGANREVGEVADLLNELIDLLSQAAANHDVEMFKTIGERYIAVCGLSKPRLDHSKRSVDFALEAMDVLHNFNNRFGIKLSLSAGIHAGAVMAGIIGTKKLNYDLWGETLALANELNAHAEPNTIRVTQDLRDRLQDLYSFEKDKNIKFEEKGNLTTWVLRKGGLQDLIENLSFGLDMDDWGIEESTNEVETNQSNI